ncbi:hypothetical protein CC1G_08922 [Coprinopsis cinerea okayama7|uniref:Uncharacterized protein n=1 Tax=Coprinopsis cinerea (strain Okayama-7 / 130 / ATCC MYA-4618 / FGSC 9003) TaxID=240176 RepID=A8P8C3_COPC7|nr:hypothetical protein CC1G_08922 [Coprinopsis cinerea okayama7\|eukprot:XP_001839543.2 hypothetical protein CC1G_08922 [Coprinopsis cinerea okayama7\
MMSWRVNGGPLVAGIQTCDPIKPNEPFTYVSWETEPHGTHNVNMTYGIYGLDPNYAEEFWLERIEYDALEGEVIPPRPQPTISTPAPEPPRVTSSKPREITKTPEVVPPPSPTSSPSTTSVRTFAEFVESDRNGATTMVMSTVPSMTRITSSLSTVPSTSPPIESGDADIDPLDGESDVSAGMASGPAAFANALVGGLVLLAMVDMLFLFARRKARRD